MLILGIETSCDETAVAVVENGRKVLSNIIYSQTDLHAKTGGVVPEVAAREHVVKMVPQIEKALEVAGVKLTEIDAIASTVGPGLLSSLVVGFSAAQTLSTVLKKPLIPVHHVAGHIYANFLDTEDEIAFPIVTLTVSGGHNEIYLIKNHLELEKLGESFDDAAGEAFDKVAVLLGLGYPGGPAIDKIAKTGKANAINFPRAMMKDGSYNFSFSGLKTAALYEIEKQYNAVGKISEEYKADVAASFQEAVCDVLTEKLLKAAEVYNAKEIHLAGGVSANSRIRSMLKEKLVKKQLNGKVRFTENLSYCTDNAAMIAGVAYYYFEKSPYWQKPGKKLLWGAQMFPRPNLEINETFDET